MGLKAKAGGQKREPVSEGLHYAICVWVFDLGTHYSEKFDKAAHNVNITWEIPGERIQVDGEDKPRVISRKYTLSLHEKSALYKHLTGWRGKKFTDEELKGFELENLLGKPCQLQVIHNNGYANVDSVVSAPKGMAKPEPETDLLFFSIEDGKPIPEGTPNWIKDIIMESEEMAETAVNKKAMSVQDEDFGDEIPF